MELEKAKAIAEQIRVLLRPACNRIEIAGSIRRRKPEVGDIELLCIPKYFAGVDQLDRELGALMIQRILGFRLNKLGSRVYEPKNISSIFTISVSRSAIWAEHQWKMFRQATR